MNAWGEDMTSKPCKYENSYHSLYHLTDALPMRGIEVQCCSKRQNKSQSKWSQNATCYVSNASKTNFSTGIEKKWDP